MDNRSDIVLHSMQMATDLRKKRKEEKARSKELRKDRLIQTRVDRRLQKVLMEQAKKRRMSVSNLVRNVLEDAFGLTPPEAGPVLDDSLKLEPEPDLGHIYAWNSVVLGKQAQCSRCATELEAGEAALIGLSEDPQADRAWLCKECGDDL